MPFLPVDPFFCLLSSVLIIGDVNKGKLVIKLSGGALGRLHCRDPVELCGSDSGIWGFGWRDGEMVVPASDVGDAASCWGTV